MRSSFNRCSALTGRELVRVDNSSFAFLFIYRLSESINVDNGLGKCLRSLLRHIVTDAVENPV